MGMENGPLKINEYVRHYKSISFIVHYSCSNEGSKKLFFAAQPTETCYGLAYDYDFLHGQIDEQMHLQIGIKQFQITMTEDFHQRLGILYKNIRNEYVEFNNKRF